MNLAAMETHHAADTTSSVGGETAEEPGLPNRAPSSTSVSKPRCKTAVIDTGAFIRLQRLETVSERCVTTPQVESEVRDVKARRHLWTLIEVPEIMVPTDADRKWVRHFAGLTGDIGFLSECDIEVVALTYMLHRQLGDASTLRTSPPRVEHKSERNSHSRAPNASAAPSASSGTTPTCPSPVTFKTSQSPVEAEGPPNSIAAEPEDTVDRSKIHHRRDVTQDQPHRDGLSDSEVSDGGESKPEDDGEGEWITPENIQFLGVTVGDEEQLDVACMTTDFSIQNLLIQMGLNAIAMDGCRVKSVKMWNLLCRACGATTRDTTKRFCPSCGHQTVDRVPVTVSSATGEICIHDNRRRRNLRGTVFSIPKTRGGRNSRDLILAEDQLLMGGRLREHRHQQRLWEKECAEKDPFSLDVAYEQQGWWSRRHLPSGRVALKGAPRLAVGCRGNPNATQWHKKGGFKR